MDFVDVVAAVAVVAFATFFFFFDTAAADREIFIVGDSSYLVLVLVGVYPIIMECM